MRRTLAALCVLGLLLAVLILPAGFAYADDPTPEPSPEPVSCPDARGYLDGGKLAQAEQAYLAILSDDPDSDCASTGLLLVAGRRCEIAAKMVDAGLVDDAKAIYKALLAWGVEVPCAVEGLEALAPAPTPTPVSGYDQARALREIGADDAAWAQFIEGVKADPQNQDRDTLGRTFWARWQRIGVGWKVYGLPALVLLVVVLGAIWLGILIRRRRSFALDIDKFALGSVKFATEVDPSDVLVVRVEEALEHLSQAEEKPHRPGVIDTPVEAPSLPGTLGTVPDEAKAVWDFIMRLIPRNTVTLSGVLQHDERTGAGLSLRLVRERDHALLGSHTIWQRDLTPQFPGDLKKEGGAAPAVGDYMQLTGPAAIWAYWVIQEHRYGRRKTADDWRPRHAFGTDRWWSYVLNLAGAGFLEEDRLDAAECMLRRALTLDRRNRHALFNLAMVHIQSVDVGEAEALHIEDGDLREDEDPYRDAERYLKNVQELSQGLAQEDGGKVDQACIFADYQLGAVGLYKYILTGGQAGNGLQSAVKHLGAAVQQAKGHVVLSEGQAEQGKGSKGRRFITEDVFAMLKAAYAGALALSGEIDQATRIIKGVQDARHFAPWVLYDLACYYSTAVGFGKIQEVTLDRALDHLRGTLRANPTYAGWARNDPSLKALREKRRDAFDALTLVQEEQSRTTPLAVIEGIGPERARILRERAGVGSVEALLEAGVTPAGRRELAEKSGLAVGRIYDWAKMADLMRLDGVGGQYAELLLAAGVDSVKELRTRKAVHLLASMTEVNAEQHLAGRLPSEGEVTGWIKQATELSIVLVAG